MFDQFLTSCPTLLGEMELGLIPEDYQAALDELAPTRRHTQRRSYLESPADRCWASPFRRRTHRAVGARIDDESARYAVSSAQAAATVPSHRRRVEGVAHLRSGSLGAEDSESAVENCLGLLETSAPTETLPEVMTVSEVAEIVGIAKRTVTRRFRDGSIPGRRVGRRLLRFHRNTILENFSLLQGINPTEFPKILDAALMAKFLRVNAKTFYALYSSGELVGLEQAVVLCKPLRFSRTRVVEWLSGSGRTVHSMREVA